MQHDNNTNYASNNSNGYKLPHLPIDQNQLFSQFRDTPDTPPLPYHWLRKQGQKKLFGFSVA